MFNHILLQTPVPRDLPLDLPLPKEVLIVLLVFSFLLHILFVNLMVGGSILTLWSQIKGLKDKEYDTLAHEIAETITVNKSLAVVLGVAPLLSINTLYTVYFYSANALTGIFWISVIPLVTVAFLLTYAHKYSWKILENNKALHISMMGLSVAIFLFIPLIFLVNVNLMLFPEKWNTIEGFAHALTLPNVFPRYFHFLLASLGTTGLFIFWYFGRKSYDFESHFTTLTRYEIRKKAYSLTFGASAAQFIIGPVVLLTLPTKGFSWHLIFTIGTGVIFALPAMYWIWKGITGKAEDIANNFWKVALTLGLTITFMGSGRHIYRATALAPHQKLVEAKTIAYEKEVKKATEEMKNAPAEKPASDSPGETIFQAKCSACHAMDVKVVGPPIKEMVSIYKNDAKGLHDWILKPGKKRPDYPQMPALGLSEQEINDVANYILEQK